MDDAYIVYIGLLSC